MHTFDHTIFKPPTFNDPEKTRLARWVHRVLTILIVLLTLMTLSIPFSWIEPDVKRMLVISQSAFIVILIALFVFVQQGHVWLTAVLTLCIFYIGTAYSHLVVYGTIQDLSILPYFVLIPLAGLFFRQRIMWVAAALSAATLTVSFLLEYWGFIGTPNSVAATGEDLLFILICLGLSIVLTLAILTETEESAILAKKTASNLAETNQDLKISQGRLETARNELEVRVIERTEELRRANQQLKNEIGERIKIERTLRDAKEVAEAATKTKSAFLANMSHEIRTPMNGVTTMISLLMDTELTIEQAEFAQVIRSSSEALTAVIDDILDFSRDESGKLALKDEPYDLRVCVAEAFELLISRAEENQLELVYYVDDRIPDNIVGDATRVRQILINLISNAIKFTDEGEIFAQVTVRSMKSEMFEIQVDVKDSGIGIDADDLDSLFLPFSQVDSSSTRRHGGSGLGLAISKRLCEHMGGHMWVTSEVASGSVFHFTFMARQAEDNPSFEETKRSELRNRAVLLLSQRETNRIVLLNYLKRWEMKPVVFEVDDLDFTITDTEQFDVAIFDFNLRGHDALIVLERLRSRAKKLPVVSYVSHSNSELRKRLKDSYLVTTLHKPINPSTLLEALQTSLGLAKSAQPMVTSIQSIAEQLARHGPLKILLVEDNPINQRVTMRLLERFGYEPDLATNGVEALELVCKHSYDIILMDVHMPEMDGLEATRRIRADTSLTRQPYIIAITAAALQDEQEQCKQAGMDDFISKPMQVEGFAETIERFWEVNP